MKTYALSVLVVKIIGTDFDARHNVIVAFCHSPEEASGKALARMLEKFPQKEGWKITVATPVQITRDMVAE